MNTIKDLILAADNGETLTTPALPTGISSAVPPPSTTPGSTTEGISNAGKPKKYARRFRYKLVLYTKDDFKLQCNWHEKMCLPFWKVNFLFAC